MCKELAVIHLKYAFRDIAMPEDTRHTFLSEIKAVIDRHGGIIRVFDTIDLQLARKVAVVLMARIIP